MTELLTPASDAARLTVGGPPVRQSGELADGRSIFFYDRAPGVTRLVSDRRHDLATRVSGSQLRWNPLFGEYTTIAGHRQGRTYKPPSAQCPLCPSRGGAGTEVPTSDYEVAVFENRFPSFASPESAMHVDRSLFGSGPGGGRCEVVCFTSRHDQSFAELPPEHVRTVIDAWADRTLVLSRYAAVQYVFCFENRGEDIGVTLGHPHGQIYGYPFVPPRFQRAAEQMRRHARETGRCLQCELLARELEADVRMVCQSEHWVCYVPFAARWPYEVRIVPRRHVADLPALTDEQRDDLAMIYLDVLGRFERLFDTAAPYIAGWQQAPVGHARDCWHLAAEIFTIRRAPGRLKYLAGSESAAGAWINDIAPEAAAYRLRHAAS